MEFDDLDFEAIEKANQEKLEQANREAEELENAKGNNDCTSGGCTIQQTGIWQFLPKGTELPDMW